MSRSTLKLHTLALGLTGLLAVAVAATPASAQGRGARHGGGGGGSHRAESSRGVVRGSSARGPNRVVVRSSTRSVSRPYAVRGSSRAVVNRPFRSGYRTGSFRSYAVPAHGARVYGSRGYGSRSYGTVYAQRRHGGVYRGGGGGRYYRPYYRSYYPRYSRSFIGFGFGYPYGYWGNPYYGSLFYPSWYGWGSPYGGYGYGGYGYGPDVPYGRYSGYADDQGGIRLQVNPKQATVFVDGYFVGEVNDFDGGTQRLALDTGVHKIEIRMPGFETLALDINILRGETIRYRGAMRPAP